MRSLVTGGLGFIGSALVRRLLRDGHDVRVLDDLARGDVRRLEGVRSEVDVIQGDVRDPNVVGRAMDGVRTVWHLAAINGTINFYERPDLVLDVGVRGMLTVLEAMGRGQASQLLLVSSSEVYAEPATIPTNESVPMVVPDPLNPRYSYGASKIISELLALHVGRDRLEQVVIVRPHNVYGPDMGWDHVIPELALQIRETALRSTGPIAVRVQGTGEETRAFCFVDDAVNGMIVAMRDGAHRNVYHVGTDVETRIADLARAICAWYGRAADIIPGPMRPGAPTRRCPDISKLRGLGFEPRVTLEDGLQRTIAWCDSHATERLERPA